MLEFIYVVNETEDKIAILHCLQMFPVYNLSKLEGGGDLGLILEVLNVCLLYGCIIAANVEEKSYLFIQIC